MRLAPSPATVFVGREHELAKLKAALEKGSLVTLWGAPGLGKTRLSQKVAEAFDDSVFVDLTEAHDLLGVCEATARALGTQLTSRGSDVADELGRSLASRGSVLLVLDNFEQVTATAKATVGRWLDRAPHARFLVTSRELLDLPAEVAFPLEPLSLPAAGKPASDSEALQLFIARASAVRGDWKPSEAELPAVREVLQALDGIPLAIELAASRMGVLSVVALRDRLKDRFALLKSQGRYPTERQATLRGAIDWSWELLDEHERSALAQLSVFRGGFPAEGAEAVVKLPANAPEVLDVLTSLHQKSLVKGGSRGGETLWLSMYLSIRDYAREKLEASAEAKGAAERHAEWALLFAEPLADAVEREGTLDAMRALAEVHENLVAVHQRAVAKQVTPAELSLRAALALDLLLGTKGPFDLHLALLDGALDVSREADPALAARGHMARGRAQLVRSDHAKARADFERALELAKEANDEGLQGAVLTSLGNVRQETGELDEAMVYYGRAGPKLEASGDLRQQGILATNVGTVHFLEGALDAARDQYEKALGLFYRLGNRLLQARILGALGNVHFAQRHMGEARLAYEEALAHFRALQDRRYEGIYLGNLGQLHHDERRLDEARRCHVEEVDILRGVADRRFLAGALESLASVELERERTAEAVRVYEEALELRKALKDPAGEARCRAGQVAAHALAGQLDRAEGLSRALPEALTGVAALHAGLLEAARAAKAKALGDAASQAKAEAAARGLVAANAKAEDPETRMARRLLEGALAKLHPADAAKAAMEVGPECRWFKPPEGERYDFKRGKALRLMLEALVQKRLSAPGEVLTVEQLFGFGWPGEKALPEAAANRVYVNLSRLKDMGLRHVLLRRDDGYLLEPSLEVTRSSAE